MSSKNIFLNAFKFIGKRKTIGINKHEKVNIEDKDESDIEIYSIINGYGESEEMNKIFRYEGEENVVNYEEIDNELDFSSSEDEEYSY